MGSEMCIRDRTYVVAGADVGATLRVAVTATNSAGSASATSAQTAVVPASPVNTSPPTISGTAQQGQTLTATAGSWGNKPQLGYHWQRCDAAGAGCTDIAGAAASTYAVTPAEVGATLRVVEKATNRFGTATAQSAQTAVVT